MRPENKNLPLYFGIIYLLSFVLAGFLRLLIYLTGSNMLVPRVLHTIDV